HAHAKANHGDGRRWIPEGGRRLPSTRLGAAGGLRELHHDTERLLRVEERRLPVIVRVVVADDVVATGTRALTRLIEIGHLERHVVDARSPRREKATHEPVGADRLDDFDLAAAVVMPRAEAKLRAALHAAVRP